MSLRIGKLHRNAIGTALLALVFCTFFSFCAPAGEADASPADPCVELNLTYGYRNTAKSGQLLPVTVTVENPTGDVIDGFLSVEIPGEESSISYTASVKLEEGTNVIKRTVTVPDSNSSGGDRLLARLFDDSGAEIATAETAVNYLGNEKEVLCGVLSDDQQDLMYFGNVSLGEGLSTKIVTLNPADLPEEEAGLSQLDIIVISDMDMNRLSSLSVKAVMDWVESGGTLILGTGGGRSTLGAIRSRLGDPELKTAGRQKVDLGMEYSTEGPDGATLELELRSIVWADAEVVQESGDRTLVLRREFGRGSVSLTAYNLCDISGFAGEHSDYTEDFLKTAVGQTGIARIAGSAISGAERLEASRQLTNTYEEAKVPELYVYGAAAGLFLLLAGVVLFRILTARGLAVYYMLGVLVLSFVLTLILWNLQGSTRINGSFIRYGIVTEYRCEGGGTTEVSGKGFFDLESSGTSAITLELPADCTVRPMVNSGIISITSGKKKMLAVTGQKQFEENIFQVEQEPREGGELSPLSAELSIGENGLEGTVTNSSGLEFSGVVLLYGEELFHIGKLSPGKSAVLEPEEALWGPVSMNRLVSVWLSGKNSGSEITLQRRELLSWYLRESLSLTDGRALLLGFAEKDQPEFLASSSYSREGASLYAVEAEVPGKKTGSFLVAAEEPEVVSGAYDAQTNCLTGGGAAVLEYSLGSGYDLSGIELETLSGELDGEQVKGFTGQTAVYNYSTGSFDLMDAGKTSWMAEELRPYLSPGNNLTVRFLPDETESGEQPVFLPVLCIRGRESSAKPESAASVVEFPEEEPSEKQSGEGTAPAGADPDADLGIPSGPVVDDTEPVHLRTPGEN